MRLIDADELKTILSEEITRRFVRWDKTITVAEWETFTRDVIDNAPTVEPQMPREYRQALEVLEHIKKRYILVEKSPRENPNCGASMKKGGAE